MGQQFCITPVYDLLLRGSETTPVGLYHLQMATAVQICRLHYQPGCLTTIKARLKTLADHGYIQADSIPTKLFRSPYYYAMAHKGMRYLEDAGCDINEMFRADRESNKHALFIEHTLELNDIVISAEMLKRTDQRYYLDSFEHERTLKRRAYKATWKSVDLEAGRGSGFQTFTIVPDAFLDFRLNLADGRQRRMPVLLEHDRGTEGPSHFKRRIRAYIMLLKTGAYQQLFGVKALTVAFTTFVSTQRLAQMRDWTRKELESTGEPKQLGMTFCFTHLKQPLEASQIWLAPQWCTPYTEDKPLALLN